MKFSVCMKDPDTLHDAVEEAVKAEVSAAFPALDADEQAALCKTRCESVRKVCSRWFEYGEYLEVEIDTEAKTCTVVPVKR